MQSIVHNQKSCPYFEAHYLNTSTSILKSLQLICILFCFYTSGVLTVKTKWELLYDPSDQDMRFDCHVTQAPPTLLSLVSMIRFAAPLLSWHHLLTNLFKVVCNSGFGQKNSLTSQIDHLCSMNASFQGQCQAVKQVMIIIELTRHKGKAQGWPATTFYLCIITDVWVRVNYNMVRQFEYLDCHFQTHSTHRVHIVIFSWLLSYQMKLRPFQCPKSYISSRHCDQESQYQ